MSLLEAAHRIVEVISLEIGEGTWQLLIERDAARP
jgi:hypothetical protein